MFSNVSALNEEFDVDNPRLFASDIKKLLSPPSAKIKSKLIADRNKAKPHTYELIESKQAEEYLIKVKQNNDQTEVVNLFDEPRKYQIFILLYIIKIHAFAFSRIKQQFRNCYVHTIFYTIRLLVNYIKKQHKHNFMKILKNGFVDFHFAAYRGKSEMIQEFDKCGVILYIRQKNEWIKLGCLRRSTKSIVYFQDWELFLLKQIKKEKLIYIGLLIINASQLLIIYYLLMINCQILKIQRVQRHCIWQQCMEIVEQLKNYCSKKLIEIFKIMKDKQQLILHNLIHLYPFTLCLQLYNFQMHNHKLFQQNSLLK